MPFIKGRKRYIRFRIVDTESNPVSGLLLSDFSVLFTLDDSPTSETLTLIDHGSGTYTVTFIPDGVGYYALELYNLANDVRIIDEQETDLAAVSESIIVTIDQDFGGVGRLKPTVSNPDTYTLRIYYSQDWQVGKQDSLYAIDFTALDSSGNWITTPLSLLPDTYHVVISNDIGDVQVLEAFMKVGIS